MTTHMKNKTSIIIHHKRRENLIASEDMESTSTDLDTMSHHQATRACQARVLVSERKEY